jgi:hypothetical protein
MELRVQTNKKVITRKESAIINSCTLISLKGASTGCHILLQLKNHPRKNQVQGAFNLLNIN